MKLTIAPVLIALATLASRRWGAAVGGWIAALPLTSGPVSFFLAMERGTAFARDAAAGTIGGVAAVVIFCTTWALLLRRYRPFVCLAAAIVAYSIAVMAMTPFAIGPFSGALLTCVAIGFGVMLIGEGSDVVTQPPPKWDLPLRMLVAAGLVFLLTEIGRLLGPRIAGLLSPFPVFTSTLALFSHIVSGAENARKLLRAVVVGSLAFVTFFVVIVLTVTTTSLSSAFLLASISALTVNAVSMRVMAEVTPRPKQEAARCT